MIAASFTDEIATDDIAFAVRQGLDVAELRIDRYADASAERVVAQAQRFAALPTIATIATIRIATEGGEWSGDEMERLARFRTVLPHVDGVDIELRATIRDDVIAAARAHDKVVIVSHHDFERTPPYDELRATVEAASAAGAEYVKLAAMAAGWADVRTLARLTIDLAEVGLIVMAMGSHGTVSRVFFPALGSRLTYAYVDAKYQVPGQLDLQHTLHHLRTFYPEFDAKQTT